MLLPTYIPFNEPRLVSAMLKQNLIYRLLSWAVILRGGVKRRFHYTLECKVEEMGENAAKGMGNLRGTLI